jgi:hypothetical protein
MAEIRVEPKRRSRAAALALILGIVVGLIGAYYFLVYRNG